MHKMKLEIDNCKQAKKRNRQNNKLLEKKLLQKNITICFHLIFIKSDFDNFLPISGLPPFVLSFPSAEINQITYNTALPKKGIGDAGSTADLRMLWSAIVCLEPGLLQSALDLVCYRCKPLDFVLRALRALRPVGLLQIQAT